MSALTGTARVAEVGEFSVGHRIILELLHLAEPLDTIPWLFACVSNDHVKVNKIGRCKLGQVQRSNSVINEHVPA